MLINRRHLQNGQASGAVNAQLDYLFSILLPNSALFDEVTEFMKKQG